MTALDRSLDDCGCFPHKAAEDGAGNPPGLSALSYRVGTHGSFMEAMLKDLGRQPALKGLTTRDSDDPAVALLDAWASVLDVLTFYQERIADEGFLRTATERRSLLELARATGYELRPGVAAATYLAFTCEDAVGSVEWTKVPAGTKAQNVPGPGELPQTFETVEEIEARPAWNALRARTTEPFRPAMGDKVLYLAGTVTQIRPGDALLVVGREREENPGNENWDFRRAVRVSTFEQADGVPGHTVVELDRPLGCQQPLIPPAALDPRCFALRQRAGIFGHNAVPWETLPQSLRLGELPPGETGKDKVVPGPYVNRASSWANAHFAKGTKAVNLDQVYSQFAAGGWVVLASIDQAEAYRIEQAAEETVTDFLLSAKTTRLTLSGENIQEFSPKNATVHGASEMLAWGERPIAEPVSGASVVLAARIDTLLPGRLVAVTGTDAGTGRTVRDVRAIHAVDQSGPTTRLVLATDLSRPLVPSSVRVNANVARATHGESRTEVLGSGDASVRFQSFALRQKPLTYVAAATPSGTASTLELRVDGIAWREVPSLDGAGPRDRVYTVRHGDDGTVTIRFGDGVSGARLPTGEDNVTVRYRVGIGLDGIVEAGRIGLLLSRPLGIREVVNPLASDGADDPETLDMARVNAPLTVLTMDRIVSLQDFEDFARAFAGIGKASAALLWDGEERLVHLTVAAADGGPVPATSELYRNLRDGMDAYRHAAQPVRISGFQARSFDLAAKVMVAPDRVGASVIEAVRAALLEAFSFPARAFAEPVTAGGVLAVMQAVDGVVGIDLDALHLTGGTGLQQRLPARAARLDGTDVLAAELLTVNRNGITLTESKL